MRSLFATSIVVLIELLMVLVVAVIAQTMNIKIVLPGDRLPADAQSGDPRAVVIARTEDGTLTHFYTPRTGQWETIDRFPKQNRRFSFYMSDIDCAGTAQCRRLPPPYPGAHKSITLIGDLNDELSGMISDACVSFPQQCVNVTYHITPEGRVDRERLMRHYPFFRQILREGETVAP